jgi:hypothetical protein
MRMTTKLSLFSLSLSLSLLYIYIDLLPSQIFGPSKFDFPPEKKKRKKKIKYIGPKKDEN